MRRKISFFLFLWMLSLSFLTDWRSGNWSQLLNGSWQHLLMSAFGISLCLFLAKRTAEEGGKPFLFLCAALCVILPNQGGLQKLHEVLAYLCFALFSLGTFSALYAHWQKEPGDFVLFGQFLAVLALTGIMFGGFLCVNTLMEVFYIGAVLFFFDRMERRKP